MANIIIFVSGGRVDSPNALTVFGSAWAEGQSAQASQLNWVASIPWDTSKSALDKACEDAAVAAAESVGFIVTGRLLVGGA